MRIKKEIAEFITHYVKEKFPDANIIMWFCVRNDT